MHGRWWWRTAWCCASPNPGGTSAMGDDRTWPRPGPGPGFGYLFKKIMELDLKWVHIARYGLILKLDEATCRRIISQPHLTQIRLVEDRKLVPKFQG